MTPMERKNKFLYVPAKIRWMGQDLVDAEPAVAAHQEHRRRLPRVDGLHVTRRVRGERAHDLVEGPQVLPDAQVVAADDKTKAR
jgi:hypothetical protein